VWLSTGLKGLKKSLLLCEELYYQELRFFRLEFEVGRVFPDMSIRELRVGRKNNWSIHCLNFELCPRDCRLRARLGG